MIARRIFLLATTVSAAALLWPIALPDLPERTRILDRDGTPLFSASHRTTSWHEDAASSLIVSALIAVEDKRFYRHPGIDPLAVARAARDNLQAGAVVSGASTITMQTARLLRQAPGRSLLDKGIEAVMAVRLEVWHSKNQIMTAWLNRAYFGRGAYGVAEASEVWFGKAPQDLSLAEAAYLIGLPQRPERGAADRKRRQAVVLASMVANQSIEARAAADLHALTLTISAPVGREIVAPHASIWLAGREQTRAEIRTTLDFRLQDRVESLARAHVSQMAVHDVGNVAALVVENSTGAILAYLGSADYFDSRSLGANDGVRMRRQPGSALKPFIYGTAFDRHLITPESILEDVETPFVEAGAAFSAENYDRKYHGPVSARRALASSYNIPAVALVDMMGPHTALRALRAAGFSSLDQSADYYGVGLALGNGEVTLLELARAYAGLASEGRPPEIHLISGEPLLPPAPGAFSSDAASQVIDILADPEARSPAFGRGGPLEMPFQMAAKTGTSKDYRDNWAIGVTPDHTVAVWAGNFDGTPMKNISGVSGAGTLLHAIALEVGSSGRFDARPDVPDPTASTISSAEGPNVGLGVTAPSDALTMRYPADGMVFQLDPVLREQHQRIRLQANVPDGWAHTRFFANGHQVVDDFLTLDPSIREIMVTATDLAGMERRSQSHRIQVLPSPRPIDP